MTRSSDTCIGHCAGGVVGELSAQPSQPLCHSCPHWELRCHGSWLPRLLYLLIGHQMNKSTRVGTLLPTTVLPTSFAERLLERHEKEKLTVWTALDARAVTYKKSARALGEQGHAKNQPRLSEHSLTFPRSRLRSGELALHEKSCIRDRFLELGLQLRLHQPPAQEKETALVTQTSMSVSRWRSVRGSLATASTKH